ncbi:hypothetical protein [Deminuibacter soli]|uniref:O-antigen polysaccharide polymerase Wzy n=1 Tax=Deminuibacter soli TaxID=2291815 RepID=A0A3E1NHN4_9BACT|nr:hypothetical protein [Deminuibacter soli]RFM27392.1 hypothetical protein DXN05_15345 [Deminuibacter soli]
MIFVFYIIGCLLFNLVFSHFFTEQVTFFIYSITNIIISIHFSWRLYRKKGKSAFLHPTVLASFIFFTLSFGITDLAFISWQDGPPPSSWLNDYVGQSGFLYGNEALFWSIIAHLTMWAGCSYIPWQIAMREWLAKSRLMKKLNETNNIRIRTVFCLYITAVLVKLLMISMGIYGITGNSDALAKYQDVKGILKIITALSDVCFFLIGIHYFSLGKKKSLLIILLIVEVFFGVMAGFKSQLFMPFVYMAFSYFYVHRKINYWYMIMVVVSIEAAYTFVQPFRQQVYNDDIDKYSVTDILNAYALAQENKEELGRNNKDESTFIQVINRTNLTGAAALAFQYFHQKGTIPEYRIQERIYFFPMMLFVPKAVWGNKPENNLGTVTNVKVFGKPPDATAAVDISCIGFELLGWGTVIVIIPIFFLVGVIQQFHSELIYSYGKAGLIIYLANLIPNYQITEFSFYMISICRGFIVGYITLKLFLKK